MDRTQLESWMVEAVRRRAEVFGELLRKCPDGGAPVPGLEWTVADLGQHVATLPAYWDLRNADGPRFDRPDDFGTFSDKARAHLSETDPARLADLARREFDEYADALAAALAGGGEADESRWLYGVDVGVAGMAAMALNELVLHGRDLVGVGGTADTELHAFERREANLVVDATMATSSVFVDDDRARAQPDGVYGLRFRGGREYTWTKSGGRLMAESGRPDRADARLNADPAVFLMTSLNRYSPIRAALSGAMVAYGRKPWRFLGLGTITIDGI